MKCLQRVSCNSHLFVLGIKRLFVLDVYRKVFLLKNSYRKEGFPAVVIHIATSSKSFCILFVFDKVCKFFARSVINESSIQLHLFGSNAFNCFA